MSGMYMKNRYWIGICGDEGQFKHLDQTHDRDAAIDTVRVASALGYYVSPDGDEYPADRLAVIDGMDYGSFVVRPRKS